jgi:hypothetical protein
MFDGVFVDPRQNEQVVVGKKAGDFLESLVVDKD